VLGRWLLHALVGEYGVGLGAAGVLVAGVVGLYSLAPAAAVAAYAALRPRTAPAAAPLLYAALFVASEWVRGTPGGLPWLFAAHAVGRAPLLLQTAELGGAALVGLPVVAAGAGLGVALARRSARPLEAPALLLCAALAWGAWRLAGAPAGEGAPFEVAVVQAAVPQRERFQPGSALRNTERHLAATRALVARARPDLVVWSETAVDDDLDAHPELLVRLRELAAETGVPLVTGAPRSPAGLPVNAVVLLAPDGGVETYAKQRLVPFSEYDPAWTGPLAPLVAPLTAGAGYAAGREARLLRGGPAPLAAPVCFEITYPDLVRRFREAGAGLIVNLSNDAWFGRTGYAELHLRHAVLRAVELRTWVVRGTNTGISAVIDPAGRVVAELPLFEAGTLRARVAASHARTLYLRAGDVPVLALLAALVALCAGTGTGPARGAGERPVSKRTRASGPRASARARSSAHSIAGHRSRGV
jgi:apolipoprotein N-acyltransferase